MSDLKKYISERKKEIESLLKDLTKVTSSSKLG